MCCVTVRCVLCAQNKVRVLPEATEEEPTSSRPRRRTTVPTRQVPCILCVMVVIYCVCCDTEGGAGKNNITEADIY